MEPIYSLQFEIYLKNIHFKSKLSCIPHVTNCYVTYYVQSYA